MFSTIIDFISEKKDIFHSWYNRDNKKIEKFLLKNKKYDIKKINFEKITIFNFIITKHFWLDLFLSNKKFFWFIIIYLLFGITLGINYNIFQLILIHYFFITLLLLVFEYNHFKKEKDIFLGYISLSLLGLIFIINIFNIGNSIMYVLNNIVSYLIILIQIFLVISVLYLFTYLVLKSTNKLKYLNLFNKNKYKYFLFFIKKIRKFIGILSKIIKKSFNKAKKQKININKKGKQIVKNKNDVKIKKIEKEHIIKSQNNNKKNKKKKRKPLIDL